MYSQEEDNECYWNVFIVTQLEFRDSIGMTNWLIAEESYSFLTWLLGVISGVI